MIIAVFNIDMHFKAKPLDFLVTLFRILAATSQQTATL